MCTYIKTYNFYNSNIIIIYMSKTDEMCFVFHVKQCIKKVYQIGEKVSLVFFRGFHLNSKTKEKVID